MLQNDKLEKKKNVAKRRLCIYERIYFRICTILYIYVQNVTLMHSFICSVLRLSVFGFASHCVSFSFLPELTFATFESVSFSFLYLSISFCSFRFCRRYFSALLVLKVDCLTYILWAHTNHNGMTFFTKSDDERTF